MAEPAAMIPLPSAKAMWRMQGGGCSSRACTRPCGGHSAAAPGSCAVAAVQLSRAPLQLLVIAGEATRVRSGATPFFWQPLVGGMKWRVAVVGVAWGGC